MKKFFLGVGTAVVAFALWLLGRSAGNARKQEEAEHIAAAKRDEEEARIEKIDAHDLVRESPDAEAHRERVEVISKGFRERVRDRFAKKLHGN